MSTNHDDILHRLETGEIGADEAGRLIAENEQAAAVVRADPAGLPDMGAYRRQWLPNFWGAFAIAALAGRYIQVAGRRKGFFSGITTAVARLVFGLSAFAALLAYLGRKSPWAHIRIQEKDGTHLEINVPVPVGGVSWLLNTIRPFVEGPEGEQLDLIIQTMEALRDEMVSSQQPLTIDVNDEGDRVQVYFG